MAILVIIERDPAPGIVSNKHILVSRVYLFNKTNEKDKA